MSQPDPIVFEREYAASPERVFAAWTDVETLGRWFGCAGDMRWKIHEWDVRSGGKIRVSLDFEEGPYEVRGEFVIVESPRHLRYRWQEDETVDVRIEPSGSGSRLRLEHAFHGSDENRGPLTAGWTNSLAQLGELWTLATSE